jgi:drug/metabolite transporter (DMT)-like permease
MMPKHIRASIGQVSPNPKPQLSFPWKANAYCFLAALSWSFGFPAGTVLMADWDLLTLLMVRLVPSTLILIVVWRLLEGRLNLNRRIWGQGLVIGGIGFGFGSLLLLYGQHISNPVTPAIAAAMMPIMGAILEVMLDKRRLTPLLILGIVCAFIGGLMAAGVRPSGITIGGGFFWCLSAIVLYAWATRATNLYLRDLSAMGQTTVTLAGASLFAGMIWLVVCVVASDLIRVGHVAGDTLIIIFAFSILSAAIAQPFWIAGARGLGVAVASFHLNAVPVYVMAIMVYAFGEDWDEMRFVGAAIVGVGVLLAQREPPQYRAM